MVAEILTALVPYVLPVLGLVTAYLVYLGKQTYHLVNSRMEQMSKMIAIIAEEKGRVAGEAAAAERQVAVEPAKGAGAGIAADVVQVETMTVENLEVAGEKPRPAEKKE